MHRARKQLADDTFCLTYADGVADIDLRGLLAFHAAHGGAAREVDVVAPGGIQRAEWREDGIYLTGWAELVFEGTVIADP